MYHGREKPTNNLEGVDGRIQRPTMTKYHGRLYMEHSEGSRNESSPHSRRTETNNRETITQTRFSWLRPDDISFRPSTEVKGGIFCILEFKRMSDVTDQCIIRTRSRTENQ